MTKSSDDGDSLDPLEDPLLRDVPVINGKKFLEPAFLDSTVDSGGMGKVYRATHGVLGITVAIKCLKPEALSNSSNARKRFHREARLTAQLSHQNLVRLYECRESCGVSYLVLEYVEGESARKRVRRKGPLSETAALRVALAVARGLSVAHRHPETVVHRDIKPDNILISRSGAVKLADLGLAKAMERLDASTFVSDGSVGTPKYMAPEQWDATARATPATDVWALGATLYFLLTGKDGLRGETYSAVYAESQSGVFPDPRESRPGVSEETSALVARCTRLDADQRPADAIELAREIQSLLASRGKQAAGPSSVLERWRSPRLLVPTVLGLLAAVLVWNYVFRDTLGALHAGTGAILPPRGAAASAVDPASGRLCPVGWEVVDGDRVYGNWARKVKEPKSGIVFVLIPPASFLMGSPGDEEGRWDDEAQHEVTISAPFYMAECEMTEGQAKLIADANAGPAAEKYPLRKVSWEDAQRLCESIGCTLPTEAQWELAARAATQTRFWWGDDAELGDGKCNVFDRPKETEKKPCFEFNDGFDGVSPVGHYEANGFGLYDMTGNVWEWCLDTYRSDYERLYQVDPLGIFAGGRRVLRGGSWRTCQDWSRVSARLGMPQSEAHDDFGVRPVRDL